MLFNKNRGFSLVELLVVISIVGILAAAGFASYSSANQQARNGRRRADAQKLRSALELYRADHGEYPSRLTDSRNHDGKWDVFMTDMQEYLSEYLSDPLIERDDDPDDGEVYYYKYLGGERTTGGWGLGVPTKGSYFVCIDLEPSATRECYTEPK